MSRRKMLVDPEESALMGSRYRCESCHKEFYIPWRCTGWGWKFNGRMCCSYNCMRALEKLREELTMEKKLDSKTVKIYRDWCDGISYRELERRYGMNMGSLHTRLSMLEATHPRVTARIRQERGCKRRVDDDARGSGGGAGEAGGRPGEGGEGQP